MSARLEGLDRLNAKLAALAAAGRPEVRQRATVAGAEVIAEAARRNAPTPGIARAVDVRSLPDGDASVGRKAGDKDGALGHLFEFGTGPRVQAATGRATGAMAPRPWLRPAFDANKDRAKEAAGEVFRAAIDDVARTP